MKRGRKPKPTSLLKAKGSRNAHLRGKEPDAPSGAPDPPPELTVAARKVWFDHVGQLEAMGILSKADGSAFVRFCCYLAEWLELYAATRRLKKKVRYHHPAYYAWTRMGDKLGRLEAEFGFTPSARTRIDADLQLGKIKKDQKKAGKEAGSILKLG